jgi:hypothetical protein
LRARLASTSASIHGAGSLHLYERHLPLARRVLAEDLPSPMEMPVIEPLTDLANFLAEERAIRVGAAPAPLTPYWANRVSASLQLGWRVARLNVADYGVVRGRSNGDGLASKPMEEQTSCF